MNCPAALQSEIRLVGTVQCFKKSQTFKLIRRGALCVCSALSHQVHLDPALLAPSLPVPEWTICPRPPPKWSS